MAKCKGVSSKTHTKKELDDYSNQNNPNNKAYRANRQNKKALKNKSRQTAFWQDIEPAEWYCYSNPFDFD